ncbi:MAG: S53 family peptidase [Solirubrobacterales bacterium]
MFARITRSSAPSGFAVAALTVAAAAVLVAPSWAGAATAKQRVVMLGLKRDEQGLARFVQGASDPASPGYGRFLRLGQVWHRYGAPRADRHKVMRFLRRAAGVRTVKMGTTGTVAMATMTPAAARRLFCVRGSRPPHRHLCRPRVLRGPVRHVVAGEVYGAGGKRSGGPAARAASGTPQGCGKALESGTFTPNQVAAATEADQLAARGLSGAGIRVDTLSSSVVEASQLRAWARCFGLPAPRFHQTFMPGAGGATSTDPEETYLDAEALATIAPGLQRITAVNVPLDQDFQGSFSLFMFGALDPDRHGGHLPDLLSISDGVCESRMTAAARALGQHLLRSAAAVGITALAASGDLGFLGCQSGAKGASWPASSEYVTGVGGTELTLGPQNQLLDQVVWSTYGAEPDGDGNASGGGPSRVWPRPQWQLAPGIDPALQAGGPTRLTPDLAAMGSFTPGLATYGGFGGWGPGGGTSAATPLTAAILALVLEQERAAGRTALGAVNQLAYTLARGPAYATAFADVVTGTSSQRPSSAAGQAPAGGAAQPGYDLATGLGSLRAAPFAAAVAAARAGRGG